MAYGWTGIFGMIQTLGLTQFNRIKNNGKNNTNGKWGDGFNS